MEQVAQVMVPVSVLLLHDQAVYLQRRHDTGHLDGYYDAPTSHMAEGEHPEQTASRAVMECAGVKVDVDDLQFVRPYHDLSSGRAELGLIYRAYKWQGTPGIQMPDRYDDETFFTIDPTRSMRIVQRIVDALGTARLSRSSPRVFRYGDTG